MKETEKFFNRGFGWTCRTCDVAREPRTGRSRLFREGEAESRFAELSGSAMARWVDSERTTLECPKCKATERIANNDR